MNLLHWCEKAFFSIATIEYIKTQYALEMRLEFYWCKYNKSVIVKAARSKASPDLFELFKEFCTETISRSLKPEIRKAVELQVLQKSPSFIVWLLWVTFGRRIISCLQDDPRERAFHMDSAARHHKRLTADTEDHSLTPSAFGLDMGEHFEKGISRKIHFDELEVDLSILQHLLLDPSSLVDNGSAEDSMIDHGAVFCVSYRHLEDKSDETLAILRAFQVAAELAKEKGKDHFRVWLDQILRQCPDRPAEKWAFFGLLPYAYYPVIAVRNVSSDESDRMWLLAEERMGYGNMGIYWIDIATMEFRFIPGVCGGPEHALRIYLRYLKTEEGSAEETYHLEDKQKFKDLADRHGITDDEQEMFEGLALGKDAVVEPERKAVWWHLILDVESYSCLRDEEPIVEEIVFRKAKNVPFDGYREWFKHKEDRVFPLEQNTSRLFPPYEEKWTYQASTASAYNLRMQHNIFVVLLYRGDTGLMERKACLCLLVEEVGEVFRIEKCYRVQLKYEEPEDDQIYLATVVKHFGGEVSACQIISISAESVRFL